LEYVTGLVGHKFSQCFAPVLAHQLARIDCFAFGIGCNHFSLYSGGRVFMANRFCSSLIRGRAARISSGEPKRINSMTSRSLSELAARPISSSPGASVA